MLDFRGFGTDGVLCFVCDGTSTSMAMTTYKKRSRCHCRTLLPGPTRFAVTEAVVECLRFVPRDHLLSLSNQGNKPSACRLSTNLRYSPRLRYDSSRTHAVTAVRLERPQPAKT